QSSGGHDGRQPSIRKGTTGFCLCWSQGLIGSQALFQLLERFKRDEWRLQVRTSSCWPLPALLRAQARGARRPYIYDHTHRGWRITNLTSKFWFHDATHFYPNTF